MAHPNDTPEYHVPAQTTLLDAYIAECAKGPEHRQYIAQMMWNDLLPAEQLQLRHESNSLYPHDLALGALYSQSILVLAYVNSRAEAAA